MLVTIRIQCHLVKHAGFLELLHSWWEAAN